MGVTQVFISHAGEDSTIAEELAQHLRNAGHEARVDTENLEPGDNTIQFMDDGISSATGIIILFSKHTTGAKWQRLEIHGAVWNEIVQNGARCIVVRLDETPLPPTLGPRKYLHLNPDSQESYKTCVEQVCQALFTSPTTSSIVAEAFRRDSANPFRHLRAEFFENQPELHAKTFALPDAIKVGALKDMTPCILEGSRGTGKSMLLLSLRARNLLLRQPTQKAAPTQFGFYLKLTRGAICNAGARVETDLLVSTPEIDVLTDVAAQEVILQMTESLFSEIAYCMKQGLVEHDGRDERNLCKAADEMLFDSTDGTVVSFVDLQIKLSNVHKRLAEFIRRRFIYQEAPSVPIATFDLPQLKRILLLVRNHLRCLEASTFVALLDEYENLFPYQQRIVNGLLKFGPPDISIKIAKKLASGDTPATTTGQELQEIHDYTRVALVYDLENRTERKAYDQLLRHIVKNMVALEGVRPFDINELLPGFDDPEVNESSYTLEVASLSRMTPEAFQALQQEEQLAKKTYYGYAAICRTLLGKAGRHREKRFAGFSDLALLGSGVIRYFQEFLSIGYHLTYGAVPPPEGNLTLPAEKQSEAVHVVSRHNLTTLSRNVERYGEELKYFLLDLGDCLRHKLLKHTSEPEAARLTIEDPEMLEDALMKKLKEILSVGVREGVFQTKEGLPAFKPKHGSDPQPTEFNICRVYAPVLQISPRLRWRTIVKCRDLQGLLQGGGRAQGVRQLKRRIARAATRPAQDELSFHEGDGT